MNAPIQQLSAEAWAPCTPQRVVLAFLTAEWEKWSLLRVWSDRRLITPADVDLADPVQNNLRASLLWQVRGALLQRVPADTVWFEVRHLTGAHFGQLLNIHHMDWSRHTANNALEQTARVAPEVLRGAPADWSPTILWGHDRNGPFTILEGNHRLTALACTAQERQDCRLVVYVGLSRQVCTWHRPDGLR